jgi:hypothetical protein
VGALAAGLTVTAAPAHAAEWEVVASGLDSPRHVTIAPTGAIYVAEAGRGGDGPCVMHPELGEFCFGFSGAITRVDPSGPDTRVVTGLPSIAGEADALGPSDVEFTGGNTWVASIGLGADPALRAGFGEGGAWLATLVTGKLSHGGFSLLADVGANEVAANPDGTDHDSNPTGILRSGDGYYVADSGGNAIVRTNHKGDFTTTTVLDPVPTVQPFPFPGFPADAVPTEVVRGPDGALYVSQLVGFPFELGSSSIWRVANGQATKFATGLTNVTDLAFAEDGSLYAVQIAAGGLLSGPIGSVVKVTPGGSMHETVVGGLFAPYGIAIAGSSAYVSTCTVCMGEGEVVRITL